jgi:hypothetical protein
MQQVLGQGRHAIVVHEKRFKTPDGGNLAGYRGKQIVC